MIITFRKWAFYAYRSNALPLTTKQIFYRDGVYGSKQTFTRFSDGHAWDPRRSPTAEVVVLVANESRNDEIWLVRKGEWPAVQLTDNEWAWDKHQLVAGWGADCLTVEPQWQSTVVAHG